MCALDRNTHVLLSSIKMFNLSAESMACSHNWTASREESVHPHLVCCTDQVVFDTLHSLPLWFTLAMYFKVFRWPKNLGKRAKNVIWKRYFPFCVTAIISALASALSSVLSVYIVSFFCFFVWSMLGSHRNTMCQSFKTFKAQKLSEKCIQRKIIRVGNTNIVQLLPRAGISTLFK